MCVEKRTIFRCSPRKGVYCPYLFSPVTDELAKDEHDNAHECTTFADDVALVDENTSVSAVRKYQKEVLQKNEIKKYRAKTNLHWVQI